MPLDERDGVDHRSREQTEAQHVDRPLVTRGGEQQSDDASGAGQRDHQPFPYRHAPFLPGSVARVPYVGRSRRGAMRSPFGAASVDCSGSTRRRVRRNVVPDAPVATSSMSPPCATIRSRAIARPSPVPPRRMLPANGRNRSAAHRLRQAGAVIGDFDRQRRVVVMRRDAHAPRARLRRIAHQVGQARGTTGCGRPAPGSPGRRSLSRRMALPGGRAVSAASRDQRRQRDRREVERRRALAGVVQRAPHQVGRPVDGLHQDLARTLHAGIRIELQPLRGQQRRGQDAAQVVAHLGDHGAERRQPRVAPQRGAQFVLHRRQFLAGDRDLVIRQHGDIARDRAVSSARDRRGTRRCCR